MSWPTFFLMIPGMVLGFVFEFVAESFDLGRKLWRHVSK